MANFRKLAHETATMQKNSVIGEVYSDFHQGERVMTVDGIAGTITAVMDGPYPKTEEYRVELENSMGGGIYTTSQLSSLSGMESVSTLVEGVFDIEAAIPVEAVTDHTADLDYPELGSILQDRLPNQNIRYAALDDGADEYDEDLKGSNEEEDANPEIGSDEEELDGGPVVAEPQVEQIDPPDACSFCGNDTFDDFQNTGRGTRARCTQCKGTMTSWGGQWQPEFPNSSQNNASEAWDYRSGGPGGVVQAPGVFYKDTALHSDTDFRFHVTAAWVDVQAKARKLRREGNVKILGADNLTVVGEVKGEHNVYETQINYIPGSRKMGSWNCGCKWGYWSQVPRTKPFERFSFRVCSHTLALQYEANARGIYGRDVKPDTERPTWQKPHHPVVVEWDQAKDKNLTRRTVPPGNMKRTFSALTLDSDGIYPNPSEVELSLPPLYAVGQEMYQAGEDPYEIMQVFSSYGLEHIEARELLDEVIVSYASVSDVTDENDPGLPGEGSNVSTDDSDPAMSSTASAESDAQNAQNRDLSEYDHDPKHRKHKTNDAREHAPNWNWGLPWGVGPMTNCDQCGGSGCGHCGGTGEVQQTPQGVSNTDPVPDESPDAGPDINSSVTASYSVGDPFVEDATQEPYKSTVENSNSANPASTGWATGQDPQNWGSIQNSQQWGSTWEASLHTGLKEGEPSFDPPTVSGVALKAADTGRVLMIQRSIHDDKDPAKGTWEFPGGHHEEGDTTSLHAGIREWEEEVGQPFPEGGHVSHTWRSGPYQGHTVVIPSEDGVQFHQGRSTTNPDDPDGDDHEQSAWWHPDDAKKNPALRSELKGSDAWHGIKKFAGANGDDYSNLTFDHLDDDHDAQEKHIWAVHPEHGDVGNLRYSKTPSEVQVNMMRVSPEHQRRGVASQLMNELEKSNPGILINHGQRTNEGGAWAQHHYNSDSMYGHTTKDGETVKFSTLHDEPEPALPSTDGAEDIQTEAGLNGMLPPDLEVKHLPGTVKALHRGQEVGRIQYSLHHDEYGDPSVNITDRATVPDYRRRGIQEHLQDHLHAKMPGVKVTSDPYTMSGDADAFHDSYKEKHPEANWSHELEPAYASMAEESEADIVAAFHRNSVLAQQMMKEVPPEAMPHTAMREFNHAEQQDLINEGKGDRARNFGDLKIADTHYAMIDDSDPTEVDLWI